jgi:hypothetical protein
LTDPAALQRYRTKNGWSGSNDFHSYQRVKGSQVEGPYLLLPSAIYDAPAG